MTPEQYERACGVFHAALDLDPTERAAFVERESAGDAVLRAEVESLLAARERAASFLEPVPAPGPEPSLRGRTIGHYEIVRELGAGGMGVVYEARQSMPRRTVALKLMRSSLASAEERSRFRFEAEVLGRLQHANIAQVYESGVHVDEGPFGRRETPWFALEFVPDGRTIVAHAEDRALKLRARIELFLQACDAVHHGHQKGVVHRDLKPSNLLTDPQGRVKVIDFGVARASEPSFGARTLATLSGQVVGTIDYMSLSRRSSAPEPAARQTPPSAASSRRGRTTRASKQAAASSRAARQCSG